MWFIIIVVVVEFISFDLFTFLFAWWHSDCRNPRLLVRFSFPPSLCVISSQLRRLMCLWTCPFLSGPDTTSHSFSCFFFLLLKKKQSLSLAFIHLLLLIRLAQNSNDSFNRITWNHAGMNRSVSVCWHQNEPWLDRDWPTWTLSWWKSRRAW